MSIAVNLYTFAKKVNSTGRPSTSPLALDCVLKDNCSVIYPVIGIDRGITWNPSSYNYAQISAFHRYYYVNDWSFAEGLWWAALSVDALATWRGAILDSEAYIARSSKNYDGAIIDTMFPAKSTFDSYIARWNGSGAGPYTPWTNNFNNGFYIVGIINNDTNSLGAVSYYAFTPSQFADFKAYLMGDLGWSGIIATVTDVSENLFKALYNPFQYVASVLWYPFSFPSGYGSAITTIKVGWWDITGISCYRLTSYYYSTASNILVDEHPQSYLRGVFLNGAPYSLYTIYAPPFGEFALDATVFPSAEYVNGYASVSCSIVVDLISGMGSLSVSVGNTRILYTQTQVAIPIQIAQLYAENNKGDTLSTISQAAITGIKQLFGGSNSDQIADIGIKDALSIGTTHMMQTGANGSLCQFTTPFIIVCRHYHITEDAVFDKGRPVCRESSLITYTGEYIQTVGAHIPLEATEPEIITVNSTLDGGVFLE